MYECNCPRSEPHKTSCRFYRAATDGVPSAAAPVCETCDTDGTEIAYFYFVSYAFRVGTREELNSFTTGTKYLPRKMSRYELLGKVMGHVLTDVNRARRSAGLDSYDLSQMFILSFGCDVDEMG